MTRHQHFILRTLWPLISRDLNSIDCCVGDSTRPYLQQPNEGDGIAASAHQGGVR